MLYGLPSVTDQHGNNIMRVNAPRFGEVSLYFSEANISFSVVLHGRKPPVSEAESRPLLYIICFHLYFV
jgi:hypothetical protein